VNYNQKGFQFICPPSVGLKPGEYDREYDDWFLYPGKILIPETRRSEWLDSVASSSQAYQMDIITGGKPEDARYLLPNASKTEIVVTLNLRMWRHVFRERALNPKAQWEIRGIFLTLYELYDDYLPCVFGDLKNENV
jgi:thymidylate synthase ThyX